MLCDHSELEHFGLNTFFCKAEAPKCVVPVPQRGPNLKFQKNSFQVGQNASDSFVLSYILLELSLFSLFLHVLT